MSPPYETHNVSKTHIMEFSVVGHHIAFRLLDADIDTARIALMVFWSSIVSFGSNTPFFLDNALSCVTSFSARFLTSVACTDTREVTTR